MRNPPRDHPRADRRVDGLLQLALAAAVVLLATSLVRVAVTRFGYQPVLDHLTAAQLAEANADRSMLDLQSGVRGYQLSGDQRFLAPYVAGQAGYPVAAAAVVAQLQTRPDALSPWTTADTAAQAWQHNYAAKAVAAVQGGAKRPSLSSLLAGQVQFDRYTRTRARASAVLTAALTSQQSAENVFRLATGVVQGLALALLAMALWRRQRRPHEPLLRTSAFPATTTGQWPDLFATSSSDESHTAHEALAASITQAACELSGAVAAHLWLAGADGDLHRVDPGQPVVIAQRRRHDVALRAHREGAIITSVSRSRRLVAVPLLHEGRTLGVIELTMPSGSAEPTSAQTEMLRAWGRQAAKAVAEGPIAANRDRLTGFADRTTMDADVTNAVEHGLATGRPVSLVVLEVDYLEQHSAPGTAVRDELVRVVGSVLSDTVRASDTAYRIGEGSFAILLPGAPAHSAASLAERLRQIIARRFVERGVTASFGVATCPDAAADDVGLVEAAESALDDAQRYGGNRAQPAHPLSEELALVRRRAAELD